MLRVKMKASDFRAISELWRILDEIYFFFRKDGLLISQTTPDKVCGIWVKINPKGFAEYVLDKDYTVGVGDSYLKAMGKMINLRTDVAVGFYEEKGEIVFKVEGGRPKYLTFPVLSPKEDIVVETTNFEGLVKKLPAMVTYSTQELYRQVKEIGLLTKDADVVFKAVGDKLTITVSEKTWKYGTTTIFKYLEIGEETKSKYSLRLIDSVVKVAKVMGDNCLVRFGNNMPLCIEIPLEDGFARFLIAPRVE